MSSGKGAGHMAEKQTAMSVKRPVDLKEEIGVVIKKHGTTLTRLVLDYFERRVRAEKEAEARKQPGEELTEVVLLLDAGTHVPLLHEASDRKISVEELVFRLCQTAAR